MVISPEPKRNLSLRVNGQMQRETCFLTAGHQQTETKVIWDETPSSPTTSPHKRLTNHKGKNGGTWVSHVCHVTHMSTPRDVAHGCRVPPSIRVTFGDRAPGAHVESSHE